MARRVDGPVGDDGPDARSASERKRCLPERQEKWAVYLSSLSARAASAFNSAICRRIHGEFVRSRDSGRLIKPATMLLRKSNLPGSRR
jgi:hypothetical protein